VPYSQRFLLLLLLHHASATYAAEKPAVCSPTHASLPVRPEITAPQGEEVQTHANDAEIDDKTGIATFNGDVTVQRQGKLLNTESLTYHRAQDKVETNTDFTLWDKRMVAKGKSAQLYGDHHGEMQQVTYWFQGRRGRGTAETVHQESEHVVNLDDFTYTTCDEDSEMWRLVANKATLNDQIQEGVARNVTVKVLGVPIFYTPYLSFPLNNARKSGFLIPTIGNSSQTGMQLGIPYYWNIDPSYDATITPRILTRRGAMLRGEFRYLMDESGGKLLAEYMPSDQVYGKERASGSYQHAGKVAENLYTNINLNYASDNQYFHDLGSNLNMASISHLERRGDLLYTGTGWNFMGRVQSFQTLDPNPAARPYQRLPQLLFNTTLPERNKELNFAVRAEAVRFGRDTQIIAGATGDRMDLKTTLSYPIRSAGSFLVPKLSMRYTQYALDNLPDPTQSSNPHRGLYTGSVDSGLIFERNTNLFATNLVQTLEPRLFYRYTPYRDQSQLPLFDTGQYDLSFSQLFREDTFSGADRVDDGHQVSAAMTSRLFGQSTGIEHLRASLGETFYFADRRVTLPGQTILTDNRSSIVGEIASQFARNWSASSTIRWNPNTQSTEQNVFRLRYHRDNQHVVNLTYRMRKDAVQADGTIAPLEQTDLTGIWGFSPQWSALWRWNYALREKRDLESFAGFEYNSCCWAVRAIARRYLSDANTHQYSSGFFLEFQLKGLGGFGSRSTGFLEQRISGYYDDFSLGSQNLVRRE